MTEFTTSESCRVAATNGTVAETLDSPVVPEALGKALAAVLSSQRS